MENEGNAGTASSSRWNPTKEQIDMLENLYKQGIRTPTADQIQQITGRLRAYGHIEGKNVFYWFQNHKARQRQKQKQESIAYFNRLFHKTSRFFYPPPCSNVACGGPYYLQQGGEAGGVHTQPHKHKVLLPVPGGYGNKTNIDQKTPDMTTRMYGSARFDPFAIRHYSDSRDRDKGINVNFDDDSVDADAASRKTLPLFPLRPSGVLYGRPDLNVENPDFTPRSDTAAVPATSGGSCDGGPQPPQRQQPFFDFFPSSN